MRLLLDTHLVLWWLADDPKLPRIAKEMVMHQAEAVLVSQASLWEVAIKVSYQRLQLDLRRFEACIPTQGFQWLSIKNDHLMTIATLPVYSDHRDPFDRLLVAQSISEALVLLTADAKLERYGATVQRV